MVCLDPQLTLQIKLTGCRALTDRSIVALTRSCPLLLELDLGGVIQLTNDSLVSIFLNSSGLRELRVNEDLAITPGAIPHLATVSDPSGSALVKAVGAYPWYVAGARAPKAEALRAPHPEGMDLQLIRPVSLSFDQLRAVDFTNCRIGDDDIEALVANAPQMRSVTLAKCSFLTDDAVYSIARLGKQLHYLHLGHVSL